MTTSIVQPDLQAFDIPWHEHLLSSALHATRHMWRRLGQLESSVLRDRLETVKIDRPIYIAGLARSGSTILLEAIADHPQVATHTYRDYWSIFTPIWANQATQGLRGEDASPAERAHGDGIMITPDSPEAIEEMLWMEFFDDLHDPLVSNVLDESCDNRAFEAFYQDHIQKMLLVRGANRYASKGNYNLSRLSYLLKLFPDARFVLPIRDPLTQIASLQKQHVLLSKAADKYPRSVQYLDRVGHYEFGAHRIPINAGDAATVQDVIALWDRGEDVRGWARYWAHLYGFVADQLESDPRLGEQVLVVRYEELCDDSTDVLTQIFAHCGLDDCEELIEQYATKLHRPQYYRPNFDAVDERTIEEETRAVVDRFASLTSPAASLAGC